MSLQTFMIVFGVTWVIAMAYGLSAFRLLWRVRVLKKEGRATTAPDPLANPLEVFSFIGWLLGGRYPELGDEVATRWAGIARILFVIAAPMILAVFAIALTQQDALNAQF
ncbi:MAG: hypothetical protein EON87_15305 [Brevundimonas sp.]|nr:MAG: hypothetical protein EON87_15305 [Brevundimonas sp.]